MGDGLELVEPGLVWGPQWRPEPGPASAGDPEDSNMYAVVARKP
jgi:S-adenosyl methyltransferase